LLSTDGITEAENAQLEEFGEERRWKPLADATEARSKFNARSCSR
jgi:serine phosphatase RsbU (regulator of sigma subunit)